MNVRDEFERLAENAAAMNAEDAFDRCVKDIRDNPHDSAAARMAYIQRIIGMSRQDSDVEFRGLCQAHAYLMHQRSVDDVLHDRFVKNAIWAGRRSLEALRNYPEFNTDPTSCKRPLGQNGMPVQ